ncbi:MAG: hypothetical protein IJN83_01260, partial [Clostridia bacterium]|nr:hypothetical protein [Clostridia bacterium]
MMEGYMNRRSFFVFVLVFMMVLLVFSFALAEEITVPFEPVPVNWLEMGFADMEGQGVTTAKPVDSSGNLNGDLSVKFNLTDEQWQGLLYNSRDLQYIYWPFEINLPDGTEAKAFVETKYGEDADINFLKTMT